MTIARRHADIEVRRGSEAALNITCRSVLSRGRRNVRKLEERQRLLLALLSPTGHAAAVGQAADRPDGG